jgi:hypothetical protein
VQSAATRSVTVVTILTLFMTPVLRGHHWVNVLTGKTTETKIVACQPGDPCPARKHVTQKVILPPQP